MKRTGFVTLMVMLLGFATVAHPQIAYVKGQRLYVLECDSTGRTQPRAQPTMVCPLWRHSSYIILSIRWTRKGQIAIETGDGSKRMIKSPGPYYMGTWLVDPKPGARLHKLVSGLNPSFSPDGSHMAYDTSGTGGDQVYICDLRTGKSSLFAKHGLQPTWSPTGNEIAFVREETRRDNDGSVVVAAYPSGKELKRLPSGVNPCDLSFSPDGSKLAVQYHLSRPQMGHSIFEWKTGKDVTLSLPEKFAPAILDDWAPDGKSVLCEWRIEDPKNDGSYVRDFVVFAPDYRGKPVILGLGHGARFLPDRKHVVYLTDHKTGTSWEVSDLVCRPIFQTGKSVVLVSNVDQIAVFRANQ